MRWTFLICALSVLVGCSTRHTVLVNNQGQEMTCETSGAGFMGAMSTYKTQQDCIAEAEKRGYRVLSETK
jgi:hypothetical protein